MHIINFAHPLTPAQIARIEELTAQSAEGIIEVIVQFDLEHSFIEQVPYLVGAVGLSSQEWQTLPLLINLPSHNVIAALLLAELHGRIGYFPAVLRLRPIAGSTPPQFEVAEMINLQNVRDASRKQR